MAFAKTYTRLRATFGDGPGLGEMIGKSLATLVLAAALLLAMALLSGCGGTTTFGADPGVKVARSAVLPEPTVQDLSSAQRPYLIGPFDKLQISVFGIQDLNLKIQTDASGRISFPLAGEIAAAGKTPIELARIIEGKLRDRYVRDPQVTVNLEETISQQFAIEGEVREPGLYPLVGRMTLLRAVATAKGTGEFAKLSDVVIFRTVGGQRYAGIYDLNSVRRGNYADPDIFPGDVIVVGDSKSRRIFKDVLQAAPALLTPIIVLLR